MNNLMSGLLQAVREAGAAILALQKNGLSVQTKANHDIVTQADLLANSIIQNHLTSRFPAIGWLSEESADNADRLQCHQVWVVDPIDGTREYAKGIPEYAISVALIERGEPVLSAVFNPATGELFYAEKNGGAWLNGQRVYCQQQTVEPLVLLASRSEYRRGEWDHFQSLHHVEVVGSIAYKLGLVAAGRAAATFSLGPKSEWDVAAGVLLVKEAGGIVTNQHRETLRFNQKSVMINGIVATTAAVNEQIFLMIRQSS